jgi:hypothetical protein
MQQVALPELYRKGFFGKAAFYVGTALRILRGLEDFLRVSTFPSLKLILIF